MKTKTHNRVFFRLFAVMLFFVGEWNLVIAQEYTKELVNTKSETSIIRRVNSTDRLVCNDDFVKSTFMLFTDGSTFTHNLSLDVGFHVSDFIIRDRMVYFCGKKTDVNPNEEVAILGYFSLTGFPSTTVYYHRHEEFAEFRKIESYKVYYESEQEFHIVLTAKKSEQEWSLIDSYELPYDAWGFQALLYYDDSVVNHTFLDISVSDNYVVATSTKNYNDPSKDTLYSRKAFLWFFMKPTVLHSNIFNVFVSRIKYPGLLSRDLIVERTTGNYFITVCSNNRNTLAVDYFNTTVHTGRMQIPALVWITPIDIKYNYDSHKTDILVQYNIYARASRSFFYHVNPINGEINTHMYTNQKITSFDYLGDMSDCFVSSGVNYENENNFLRLYKYKYNEWIQCPEKTIIPVKSVNVNMVPYKQDFITRDKYYYRKTMNTTMGTTSISVDCESSEDNN